MRNTTREVWLYIQLLARKWMFWVSIALDAIGLIAGIYPNYRLSPFIYILITFIGFLWASYSVYNDKSTQSISQLVKPSICNFLPISFVIALDQELPYVEISFYAVNYSSREIVLQSIHVKDFRVAGLPTLESIIDSDEIHILSKQDKYVTCKRTLLEAEVFMIKKAKPAYPPNASFLISTRILMGRKSLYYETPQLYSYGRASGIPNL